MARVKKTEVIAPEKAETDGEFTNRIITVKLESLSTYSQSTFFQSVRTPGSDAQKFDETYWRERCHVVKNENDPYKDHVYIPAQQLKAALVEATKSSGRKIPGRANAVYWKLFMSAVVVVDNIILPIKLKDVEYEDVMVSADGTPGGSAKVKRRFPIIHKWSGTVKFAIMDPVIGNDIFKEMLTRAGILTGLGRWRPAKNGQYGRFKIVDFTSKKLEDISDLQ